MGHHHGHPLTRAMELRPDHWSTTLKSHLEISRIYALTKYYTYSINHEIFTTHVNIMSIFVTIPHSYLIFSQPQLILPKAMKIESYIMPIPCQGTSFIFHESLHISYQLHKHPIILNPWTNPIHTHHASHALSRSNHPKYINHTRISKGNRTWCILVQPLAQAEESRWGERVSRSSDPPSPRRGLEKRNSGAVTHSRLGETSSPEWDVPSLKAGDHRLSDSLHRQKWTSTTNLA